MFRVFFLLFVIYAIVSFLKQDDSMVSKPMSKKPKGKLVEIIDPNYDKKVGR